MESALLYPPPLFFPLTYIADTYPEHRLPLYDTRQKVGHAVHDFFISDNSVVHNPRVEIRETHQKYYLDAELPGLSSVADVKIQWSNPKSITIRAEIGRVPTPEETSTAKVEANGDDVSAKKVAHKQPTKEEAVHILVSERHMGSFMRAFYFGADVDHDTLKASLNHGLLSLVIDKKPHEDMSNKQVKVEHATAASVQVDPATAR